MTGYELSRCFYDWAFENRTVFKPTVSALYFYLVEVCNRLGWKNEFSISAKECMEGMGVSGYNTYKGAFDILCANGFVTVVKKSCNHHQANIITLSNFNRVSNKAADNVPSEQSERSGDIHKTTKPTKPKTDKDIIENDFDDHREVDNLSSTQEKEKSSGKKESCCFDFRESLISIGVEPNIADDWIKVRKTKRATNTETAFNQTRKEIEKSGMTPNECIKLAAAKSWQGFNAEWITSKDNNNGSSKNKPDILNPKQGVQRDYEETF